MTPFACRDSKTYSIKVGCGNLYCTVEYNTDGTIHKIRIHRNSKFQCSLMVRDALTKQATYQVRRDPQQLIKDLKGNKTHACEKYNITCKAYSCQDAISQIVSKEVTNATVKTSASPVTTK